MYHANDECLINLFITGKMLCYGLNATFKEQLFHRPYLSGSSYHTRFTFHELISRILQTYSLSRKMFHRLYPGLSVACSQGSTRIRIRRDTRALAAIVTVVFFASAPGGGCFAVTGGVCLVLPTSCSWL